MAKTLRRCAVLNDLLIISSSKTSIIVRCTRFKSLPGEPILKTPPLIHVYCDHVMVFDRVFVSLKWYHLAKNPF